MISNSLPGTDYSQYAIWLVTLLLVAVGFRYAKDVIAFVLDKVYEFFIESHHGAV